jgi:hypothetical protein
MNIKRRKATRTHKTPPEIARELGVANAKVLGWIYDGELEAIDLAPRGSSRPRFSISAEAMENFLASRRVIPGGTTTQKLRRRAAAAGVKEFF